MNARPESAMTQALHVFWSVRAVLLAEPMTTMHTQALTWPLSCLQEPLPYKKRSLAPCGDNAMRRLEQGPSPSHELNQAFTPLIIALRANIDKAGWLNDPTIRGSIVPVTRYPGFPSPLIRGPIFTSARERLTNPNISPYGQLEAPIGEYGQDFATEMIGSAAKLIDAAVNPNSSVNIIAPTNSMNDEHATLLRSYTFRSSRNTKAPETAKADYGPYATLGDGIASTLFAAGFFTMYRVPGFDDPNQLLKALADQRL